MLRGKLVQPNLYMVMIWKVWQCSSKFEVSRPIWTHICKWTKYSSTLKRKSFEYFSALGRRKCVRKCAARSDRSSRTFRILSVLHRAEPTGLTALSERTHRRGYSWVYRADAISLPLIWHSNTTASGVLLALHSVTVGANVIYVVQLSVLFWW